MTESLPAKLSPLGPQLTKFFQKDKEPEKSRKTIKAKKQRIITVTEVIDKTPPRASAQKTRAALEEADIEVAPSEAAVAEVTSAEDLNLESTIEHIDQMLLDMAAEEAAAAAKETVTAASKKGKEIADEASEDEAFAFQNLVGEHLTKAEIKELKEYAQSCGYKPGALLFGGVDDEKLECIRDQTGAKVISTLSKSIGFPKLEADISRYRRQHVVGSLFYSNFKVNDLSLNFYCF
jgi:DNA polymerase I-like protein with 3'-5' exonuclease and polymerase domains